MLVDKEYKPWQFKPGTTPWNKGTPQTEECKQKISEAKKGRIKPNSGQFRPGFTPWNKDKKCPQMSGERNGFHGRKHTEETKRKMSESKKELFKNDPDRQKGKNNNMYGKSPSAETRKLLSQIMKGKFVGRDSPNFGRTPVYPKPYKVEGIPHIIRSSWEEEIAFMLIDANIDYDYEARFPIIIDGRECNYNADFTFMVDDKRYVVEPHSWFDVPAIQKFNAFNKQYPDITFIILAGKEPDKEICDIFIKWDDRAGLIDKINGVI